jgi:hypothetical protein
MKRPSDSFILLVFISILLCIGYSIGLKEVFDATPELAPKAGVPDTLKASACAAASESSSSSELFELRPVRFVVTDYFCPKLLFFNPGIYAD